MSNTNKFTDNYKFTNNYKNECNSETQMTKSQLIDWLISRVDNDEVVFDSILDIYEKTLNYLNHLQLPLGIDEKELLMKISLF